MQAGHIVTNDLATAGGLRVTVEKPAGLAAESYMVLAQL
jgi:hypothetical protein